MTERVYLHVGGPKSGTTYLQGLLRRHRDLLAEQGVLVAGRSQGQLVHAAMVLRGDGRLADLPARASTAWERLVQEVRDWPGPAAVVSYELFSNLAADQARRALADLSGLQVHVVVTARDLGGAVASAWQERLKFGLRESLEDWTPPDDTVVGSEWGWRTLDPASVATRWRGDLPAEQVHVVTVPREGDPAVLWERFAEACDLPALPLDPAAPRVNESLDVVASAVLLRANPLLADFLRTGRDHAVWSRDLLANRVLSRLGSERLVPTPEQLDQARARYEACVAAVTEAGYRVHGDLEDLRPTSGSGRSPGEVTDAEVADAAVRALVGVLREVRNDQADPADRADQAGRAAAAPAPARPAPSEQQARSGEEAPDPRDPRGPRGVRRVAAAAAGLASRPVLARNAELHARVDALEAQLDDRRRLQQRLAALTDLVAELLLPSEGAEDDAEVARLLAEYRRVTL